MKYILANNATATLSASITDSETSLVLTDISATLATALGAVDANNRILLTLANLSETVHEIVEVTAWNAGTSTATVTRAQDGTSAQAFDDGATVEIRVGKKQLESLLSGTGANSILIPSVGAVANGTHTICIGSGASANGGNRNVVLGSNAQTNDDSFATTCLGHGAGAWDGSEAVVIGHSANIWEDSSKPDYAIAIGSEAMAVAMGANAIGGFSVCYGKSSVAIGHTAELRVDYSAHVSSFFVGRNTKQPYGFNIATDNISRVRSTPLIMIGSGIIDLTDGTATAQIELPAGTHFFPDRIDVVITEVDTPGGSPAITVGTTAGGTDILAATVITKNAAQQRQKISPDSDDGVDDIHISVSTAGSGTTYNCRVVVTGYLIENE